MNHFTKVADGIYTLGVPFFDGQYKTAVTLVHGNGTFCLIDSGAQGETVDSHIFPALKELGLSPAEVGCLLATHTHFDHVGGHMRFRELSGCRILLAAPSADEKTDFPVDGWVEENQTVCGRLKLVYTPGHAGDAVSWLDEKTGTLITGDSFQADGTYGVGLALVSDPQAYARSVKKARELAPEQIVAGHAFLPFGQVIPRGSVEAFFNRCLSVLEQYRAYLNACKRDKNPDIGALSLELIARYGRHYDRYIVRGDHVVSALLRENETQRKSEESS